MVVINFTDKQKEKIALLNIFDNEILNEFLRIAVEFLKKEINNKMLNAASQKLNVEFSELKEAIECLMWIIMESVRLNLNEKEFNESLTLVGFKQELIEQFYTNYTSNIDVIKTYLESIKLNNYLDSYFNLEWRIDVKIASRSIRDIAEPEIVLKFDLENAGNNNKNNIGNNNKTLKTHILQTDPLNLMHLTNSLEEALNEIKSNYSRRVFRSVV